jgi:ABC-type molybdenum transport system ATPase subunit/photorepair protein PhrA
MIKSTAAMTIDKQTIVEFRAVNFEINGVKILDDINLQINKGEILFCSANRAAAKRRRSNSSIV